MDNNKIPEQASLFAPNEIPVTKSLKQRRNEAIRADFDKETKKNHRDANYVVGQLSEKYWLEEDTIWRILWKIGRYKTK